MTSPQLNVLVLQLKYQSSVHKDTGSSFWWGKCVEKCVIDKEPEFGTLVVYREYIFYIFLFIKILK